MWNFVTALIMHIKRYLQFNFFERLGRKVDFTENRVIGITEISEISVTTKKGYKKAVTFCNPDELSDIFVNYGIHSIHFFVHIRNELELGSCSVQIVIFSVNLKVCIAV